MSRVCEIMFYWVKVCENVQNTFTQLISDICDIMLEKCSSELAKIFKIDHIIDK